MKRLSKEEILKKNTVKTREIEIEEWGGSILIRSLNAYSVLKLKDYIKDGQADEDYYFHLVKLSVVDDEFREVFTLEEARNIEPTVLNKLLIGILDLNSLDKDAVEKAREELKNVLKSNSPID